jgi:hypothetical protein
MSRCARQATFASFCSYWPYLNTFLIAACFAAPSCDPKIDERPHRFTREDQEEPDLYGPVAHWSLSGEIPITRGPRLCVLQTDPATN